jgi:integrase
MATIHPPGCEMAPKTAQSILRHATSDITLNIYTHARDTTKRTALERYESRLERLTQRKS